MRPAHRSRKGCSRTTWFASGVGERQHTHPVLPLHLQRLGDRECATFVAMAAASPARRDIRFSIRIPGWFLVMAMALGASILGWNVTFSYFEADKGPTWPPSAQVFSQTHEGPLWRASVLVEADGGIAAGDLTSGWSVSTGAGPVTAAATARPAARGTIVEIFAEIPANAEAPVLTHARFAVVNLDPDHALPVVRR